MGKSPLIESAGNPEIDSNTIKLRGPGQILTELERVSHCWLKKPRESNRFRTCTGLENRFNWRQSMLLFFDLHSERVELLNRKEIHSFDGLPEIRTGKIKSKKIER
ncbi:MAG: hypothetical protein GX089_14835 [Fibrobacter sp.]|jgi:hypothetical protein|nr:hypothetical protein [Fibrobacter sp.]